MLWEAGGVEMDIMVSLQERVWMGITREYQQNIP